MKNILIVIGLVAIVGVAAFLFLGKNYTNTSIGNPQTNATNEATLSNNVVIKNFAFSPSTLTVKAGTTVTWTNNDSTTHSVKSSFSNSGDLTTGSTFKFTFNAPGTFNYSCGIHPGMTGTIVVQ